MSKISYILKRSQKLLGNISLRVKNGKIVVNAPFWISSKVIDNFVNSKSDWINKVLSHQPQNIEKNYTNEEKHLLYGQEFPLIVKTSSSLIRTHILFNEKAFLLNIYQGFRGISYKKEAEKAFLFFYLQELTYYLTDKVNFYTNILGVVYSRIEVKKVSSIWGSCSPSNVLSFNRKLIQSPKEVIDYVVIHEVCHLQERNHSSRFWGLVRKFDMGYKKHRLWLHQNGVKLDI